MPSSREKKPGYYWFTDEGLNGMSRLNLEERGAYRTILDLIYDQGRAIRYDPDDRGDRQYLAGRLNCSTRKVVSIVHKSLVEKHGKLYLHDGFLGNKRADSELSSAQTLSRTRSEAGKLGGIKSAEKRCKSSKSTISAQAKGAANHQAKGNLPTLSQPKDSFPPHLSEQGERSTEPPILSDPPVMTLGEFSEACIAAVPVTGAAPNLALAALEPLMRIMDQRGINQIEIIERLAQADQFLQKRGVHTWKYYARCIESQLQEEETVDGVLTTQTLDETAADGSEILTLDDLEEVSGE